MKPGEAGGQERPMLPCPHCGVSIPERDTYCCSCGKRVYSPTTGKRWEPQPPAAPPSSPRKFWFCGSGDCIGSDAHRAEKRREGFDAGYQRGQEAMRERAAAIMPTIGGKTWLRDAVLALPLTAEKEKA